MAEVKPEEDSELWELKEEQTLRVGLHIKEEPQSPHIKEEPEELPFHIITVKTEEDDDKASVLQQKPTEERTQETNDNGTSITKDSSDTDHSEDCSEDQAPKTKRSYAMIPPDSVSDSRPFSCSECGKRFLTKSDLGRHVSCVHKKEKPHKCSVCEKRFAVKCTLKSHMMTHTGERPHQCSLCDKKFLVKGQLEGHMRMHRGEKPFVCSVCQKGFSRKGDLILHTMTHAEGKPFVCSVCSKGFKQPSNLRTHIKTHSAERKLGEREQARQCPLCFESLHSKYNLPLHLKLVHHICPVCEKSSADEKELEAHLRTHEEEVTIKKPFNCSECGQRFSFRSHLQSHLKTHESLRSALS